MRDNKTLTQNLTYMAIMAAINVVFSMLAMFLPTVSFALMLLLPLTSALVVLFCKERYFILYAAATILLCMLVTASDASATIFNILPSLVSGFVFGSLLKRKIHTSYILIISATVQLAMTYASIPLIQWIYGVNMVDVFQALLQADDATIKVIAPLFFYSISLAQAALSYIVIHAEIKKFKIIPYSDESVFPKLAIVAIGFAIVAIGSAFLWPPLAYVFLLDFAYFSCFAFIDIFKAKKKWINIVLAIACLLNCFIFSLLYPVIPSNLGLLLFGVFLLPADILAIMNKYLIMAKKVDRI